LERGNRGQGEKGVRLNHKLFPETFSFVKIIFTFAPHSGILKQLKHGKSQILIEKNQV
jgi:hypothetical protein